MEPFIVHIFIEWNVVMNRREFLELGTLVLAGVASNPLKASQDQPVFLIASENYSSKSPQYWNTSDKALISRVVDIILPRDEFPGGLDAGVPKYIELMVFEWLDDAERKRFLEGMKALNDLAEARFKSEAVLLSDKQLTDLLNDLEKQSEDHPWYNTLPITRDYVSDAPFICQVKELCAWGFFNSEVGGTQVLRYEMMPMAFDGHRELDPESSSWVADLYP